MIFIASRVAVMVWRGEPPLVALEEASAWRLLEFVLMTPCFDFYSPMEEERLRQAKEVV